MTTNGQAHVKKLAANLELVVRWSVIFFFFRFGFPDIPEKLRRRKRRRTATGIRKKI